ncbi:MAG: 1-acyl-sn-glycerol-3-phosphate acyltransferase, partial [Myxococcota bacterium]
LISPIRRASVRVGDEIDLKAYVAEHSDLDDDAIARRLRHELHTRISGEERVVAGPEMPPPDTVARHVMRGADLKQAIAQAVEAGEGSEAQLERKANSDLKSIASRYRVQVVRILDRILYWVFNRIYDGIVVDEAGLARTFDLVRNTPIVLCPSHRSHVDYLVLSYVLYRHGLTPPYIAAGANLSFFPLGFLFRSAGAFFLRRTFKDDKIYAAVFRGYVAELLRLGASIEFFPEGTRSRTGKMLMPRFGMFSMIVGAWRQGAQKDIQFVPVSIDYDRIIEARSYEKELHGEAKKSEDVRGLLKTTSVLRSRYGRVHLQFGQPFALSELADEFELPQDTSPEHDEKARALVEKLGFRINHDIARISTVSPTAAIATAILSHRGRGVAQSRLLRRAMAMIEFLDDNAARLSELLLNVNTQGREAALQEALSALVDDGMIVAERAGKDDEAIYRVPEEKRILLDYHKNAVMNYFAPAALVARSLRHHGLEGVSQETLRKDVKFLSRLFKREFLFRADSGFDVHFEDVVASLTLLGIVDFDDSAGSVTAREKESVEVLAGLTDATTEAYWITLSVCEQLAETPLPEKELKDRALERARRSFLEGEITRPEAANQNVVSAALGWLLNEGVLAPSEAGNRKGPLQVVDLERLSELRGRTGELR